MKHLKPVILICFIIVILLAARGVWLTYMNLRGARPAFGPPAADIVREMEKPVQNSTDFSLTLPEGFSISIFAKDLGGPRVLTFDPRGTLLVSIPSRGQVVALSDENNDGIADRTEVILDHLNQPHGITFHPTNRTLYIAETDQVAVYDYNSTTLKASNKRKIVDLPGGGNHFTRTIGFAPDKNLYISVGSSCNVCIEDDERRAKILVVSDRGTADYATGLRNAVFFTWHPQTREMWATDMGRDLLGDDIPPDEVNIVKYGKFYGWPYCYGKNVQDTTFRPTKSCEDAVPSHIDIPAHSAPLGLAFIPSTWPSQYRDDLLVAYHGSWNRSIPTGYKVVRMKLDEQGNYQGAEDFITGWFILTQSGFTGGGVLGRPVDLIFGPDGILYISDDKAGVIYRVVYQNAQ